MADSSDEDIKPAKSVKSPEMISSPNGIKYNNKVRNSISVKDNDSVGKIDHNISSPVNLMASRETNNVLKKQGSAESIGKASLKGIQTKESLKS